MDDGKGTCPYLGSQNSQESHFAIPTTANYCYKVEPQEPIRRFHQEKACLTRDYSDCPVFSQSGYDRLPGDIRAPQARRAKLSRYLLGSIPVLIILVGIAFVVQRSPEKLPMQAAFPESTLTNTTVAATTTFGVTPESPEPATQVNLTRQPQTPTATLPPTVTPDLVSTAKGFSPTPGPKLLTPFGPGDAYLLHQVKPGESLPRLAEIYQTSEDALVAINGLAPGRSIQADQVLVIMPGRADAAGIEPLSTLFVKRDANPSELAAQYDVTVDELRYYNQLGSDDLIPAGRRLIFPVRTVTQTPAAMETATLDQSNALTEPFGPGDAYLLHRVAAGESLPILEKRYHTSAEVIQAANVIYDSLHVDQVLIIIPARTDPEGVQKFKPYFVDQQISIEKLASQLETSVDQLVTYNDLDQGERNLAGQWIIYPSSSEQ